MTNNSISLQHNSEWWKDAWLSVLLKKTVFYWDKCFVCIWKEKKLSGGRFHPHYTDTDKWVKKGLQNRTLSIR